MSNQTRISKLNQGVKNKISWSLRQNGYMYEDIKLILTEGKLKDILDIVDVEELLA